MARLKLILEIIKLIPQIWAIIRAVVGMIKKAEQDRISKERSDALKKLQDAKTEQEVVDAADDYLSRG